jgi:hypothetical protein
VSTTDVLSIVGPVIGLIALGVSIHGVQLHRRRFGLERSAELVVEDIKVHDNRNVAGLRQPMVTVRNAGGATAHQTGLVIADLEGRELTHRYAGPDQLAQGASARIVADLPVTAPGVLVNVRVVWQDARGHHSAVAGRVEGSRKPEDGET